MAARSRFTFAGFAARLVFGIALVVATWNPNGYSFAGWVIDHEPASRTVLALAGVSLLIVYVIYVRATLRSIGVLGIVLSAAFIAALLWVLVSNGLVDIAQGSAGAWAALVGTGLVLGIGMSWSHIRRGLTGQADVDDVGD